MRVLSIVGRRGLALRATGDAARWLHKVAQIPGRSMKRASSNTTTMRGFAVTITPRELADGLAYWCRPRRRPWPEDLHNAEYSRRATERPFSDGWWVERMLPRLRAWRATRPLPGWVITRNY
jgi:hypothetical protein